MKTLFEIPNLRVLKVKFLGPTNIKGSRIKIYEPKRSSDDKIQSVTLSYDYSIGNTQEQAFKFLTEKGFNIVGRGSDVDNYQFFCDNWGNDFVTLK